MTCVVGLEKKGIVWIGGDSAATAKSFDQEIHGEPKVFFNGPFLLGFAGAWRFGALVRYSFRPPKRGRGKTDLAFLSTDFVDALRELLDDKGGLGKDKEADSADPLLIGYNGHLYGMEDDFSIRLPDRHFLAIGSGDSPALGSLHSTRGWEDPEARVTEALYASSRFCAAVRPPFVVLHT